MQQARQSIALSFHPLPFSVFEAGVPPSHGLSSARFRVGGRQKKKKGDLVIESLVSRDSEQLGFGTDRT